MVANSAASDPVLLIFVRCGGASQSQAPVVGLTLMSCCIAWGSRQAKKPLDLGLS